MRPVPIDDSDVWPGTKRIVMAAPDGSLVNPDIAPLEVIVESDDDGARRIFSKWTLEEGELAKLINDGFVWVCCSGIQPPIALVALDGEGS